MATMKTNKSNYDVFLSFRGTDTRKAFTDHLYTALKQAGVQTFRDDDEIERGENINSKLVTAIEGSRMSVMVFSKDYASSKACLAEVDTILEHSKKGVHEVLPVFYHVDPSEIKQQARVLGAVATEERQNRWAQALQEAAEIAGMNLVDQYESTFIQDVVKVVEGKLIFRGVNVHHNLVGMESRVKKLNLWLKERSFDVGIRVISGMGGIGKTTAAKHLYNLNYKRFDGSSFIKNIGEASKDRVGLVRLQRQLLSDILHKEEKKIFSVDEGLNRIQFILRDKRVLLVLDDVDELDQLNAIFGSRSWFSPGSKIIITTRREHLLTHESYVVHKIERLNYDESLELFSWHAFGQRYPFPDFVEHSKKIVHHCQGLPLALEVLGSSVAGLKMDLWEAALKRLGEIPETKIREKLKISYDSLQDQADKNLFLELACFFVGKNKKDTVTILDGCGYHTAVGIQDMISRNLITIENDDKIKMHQLLQDMGRHIVYQEFENPEDRSRLWRHNESFDILNEKSGTTKNLGLILDMDILKKSRSFDEHVLETSAFERMKNLRLLKLSYVQLSGTYESFPKKIRWLYWRGLRLKSLPNGFPLDNVVALDLRNSSLRQIGKQTKVVTGRGFEREGEE